MAIKNVGLDATLADEAMKEFLSRGYKDASLRRIASAAKATTGSIYMRYKNKDELFSSLIRCIVEETEIAFEELKPIYMACVTIEDMMKAVEIESDRILAILFGHYEAAVLLLCKSEGSSSATFFEDLLQRKIEESESFFGFPLGSEDYRHALDVLLTMQPDMSREILRNAYTETQAQNCMKILMRFSQAGWNALMGDFLKKKEEVRA